MSLMLAHKRGIAVLRRAGSAPAVAAQSKQSVAPKSMLAAQQHEALLLASLKTDLGALSDVASMERRQTIKRDTLLPKYAGQVDRLCASGNPHELIGYYLVWLFDCGAMEQALALADWCCAHGQNLPERFSSPLPAFVARQVIDWAEQAFNAGHSPDPFFAQVFARLFTDAAPWDAHEDVKARCLRLRGLMLERDGDLKEAVAMLEKALAHGAKVKTVLGNVQKRLSA